VPRIEAHAQCDAQGRPTGTEPITNMQSLTRSLMNAAGQVIAVDRYTNLDGLTYSTATGTLGLEGENYLRTKGRKGRKRTGIIRSERPRESEGAGGRYPRILE
jgi:hypothetical protein